MKSSSKEQPATEALIKALNLNQSSEGEPTKDWLTAQDLANASNRSLSHISKRIRQGLLAGTIETKTFRVKRSGITRCVPYYKVKK